MTDEQFNQHIADHPEEWEYCVKASETAVEGYRNGYKKGYAIGVALALLGIAVVTGANKIVGPKVKGWIAKKKEERKDKSNN